MIEATIGLISEIFAALWDDGTSGLDNQLTTQQINAVESWLDSSFAALSAATPRGAGSIPPIPPGLPNSLYSKLHSLRETMKSEAHMLLKKYEQDQADRDQALKDKHYHNRSNHEVKQYRDKKWVRYLEEQLNSHRAKKKPLLDEEPPDYPSPRPK